MNECLCVISVFAIALGFSGNDGRRESQGSLSSGASLELGTSATGKNEVRNQLKWPVRKPGSYF